MEAWSTWICTWAKNTSCFVSGIVASASRRMMQNACLKLSTGRRMSVIYPAPGWDCRLSSARSKRTGARLAWRAGREKEPRLLFAFRFYERGRKNVATILVIEDEQVIRRNIAEILSFEGYATLEAENGRVGVERALQHVPDLIICDVNMPELDGFGVIRELQADLSTAMIPFIFLTARTDRQSMRYGMELGADDYITKPFTTDELVSAVRTRFRKHAVATDTYNRIITGGADTLSGVSDDQDVRLIGTTLRGYQLWERIGEGGAGAVYKAYQASLGRHVAIKVLKPTFARNVEFVHRFQTEAELVARLEHPHIIPL